MTYRTAAAVWASLGLWALAGCAEHSSNLSKSAAPAVAVLPSAQVVREEPFPIPVIELRGSGSEIGDEHARDLASDIRTLHDRYFSAYFHSPATKLIALTAAALFEPRISPEHLAEVRSLAAGTSIEPRQMLLAQCFLDLRPLTACSTITLPASASPDGVARFGRNLDFPSFDVADKASVVLVYHPDGRYAFASIAWPGMIGVLTGMNEHGLTLANMEVHRGPRVPSAMPYTLLYRSVLERCRTVDEAVEYLQDTPRQSANNLMLMDASGARAVVEIKPEGIEVRRGTDEAALISTNHQRGQDCDTAGRCARYDLLHDESREQFGDVDVNAIESMLAGASQAKLTMQSMVFEPANRVVYLSTGKDAARGTFHRLDLSAYFESTVISPHAPLASTR